MRRRCVDNILWGYCDSEPTWEKEPTLTGAGEMHLAFGTCKLNHENCGKYVPASEEIKEVKHGRKKSKV